MNLVKGDKVIVIAGRDKGKTGTIQKVIPEQNRVVVEGIQIVLVPKGSPVPSNTYQGITSVSPMCFVEGFEEAMG